MDWISIENKSPGPQILGQSEKEYIVYVQYKGKIACNYITSAFWHSHGNFWWKDIKNNKLVPMSDVTHWTEFPEPPH